MTNRSRSAADAVHHQRAQGVYGDIYGSDDWKNNIDRGGNRRVTMLPPDFRCSPQLRQQDSALYRGQATAPGGMYNYDNIKELPEEPLISDAPRESPDSHAMDNRRKTHFELQAATAIIDVDSAYVPGGQARTKAESMFRAGVRSRNGRRAYPEYPGHHYFATRWDSALTRKHDIAIALPPGVAEKIQERAWKQVERTLRNGKTGFAIQPELVPKCSTTSLNMHNVDSSLTRKFGSSFLISDNRSKKKNKKHLPPL